MTLPKEYNPKILKELKNTDSRDVIPDESEERYNYKGKLTGQEATHGMSNPIINPISTSQIYLYSLGMNVTVIIKSYTYA